jgi:long-chain acyl-CoA synthetase
MHPYIWTGLFGPTNEVITLAPDGKSRMFHTGDLGKVDKDGYVYVTGRLKELYKLENCKFVCPTPIEQAIGMSRFISLRLLFVVPIVSTM